MVQSLEAVRQLRATAPVNLALNFRQARRKLVALRLLLLAMLGDQHPLYRNFDSFLYDYLDLEDHWGQRMQNIPHAPAVVLRYVQLRLHTWFRAQETSTRRTPVEPPDFDDMFHALNEATRAWVPDLPEAYLLPPAPPPAPVPAPRPRAAPAAAPANPAAPAARPPRANNAERQRGTAVVNPSPSPLFARFQTAVQDRSNTIKAMMTKAGDPPLLTRLGTSYPMCVSYHVRGRCWSTCPRSNDHCFHTNAEDAPLVTWTTAGLA